MRIERAAARAAILGRVRDAVAGREEAPHPGGLQTLRPDRDADLARLLETRLRDAGGILERMRSGTVAERVAELIGAARWVAAPDLPDAWRPTGDEDPPEAALWGISRARAAAARSGSLLLDARGDRAVQLLPPRHLVLVHAADVYPDLGAALAALAEDPSSALGIQSGPSASADIGRVLVTGVHGPGHLHVLLLGDDS